MSTERLRQLAIALMSAVVLWGLASVLRGGGDERTSGGFAFPEFPTAELTEITMVGGGESVVLSRNDSGQWTVNGFRATPSLVTDLIETLSGTDFTNELISISASSHERLEVTPSNGRALTLDGTSGEIGSFIAGKRGPGFGTIYARYPDSDDTYLLRTALDNHVSRSQDDWREHEILMLEPEGIASLEVARGGAGYTISRGDSTWAFANGSDADSAQVSRLLGRFRSVRANGFASDSDMVDFNRPELVLDLRDSAGGQLARLEFDSVSSGFWVRASNDSTIYQMPTWTVQQLAPADSTLR
jgi:hypothetical protein